MFPFPTHAARGAVCLLFLRVVGESQWTAPTARERHRWVMATMIIFYDYNDIGGNDEKGNCNCTHDSDGSTSLNGGYD